MELRHLRSFRTAARLRSISRAAEELGIGQPAVTTHVKQLEEQLGTLLFDRVKRPIQLTSAGSALLQIAAPLLDGIDGLVRDVGQAEQVGPVRVAATHEIVAHTLLDVVKRFLSSHPHVHLRIHSRTSREVLKMVATGEADLAIVPGIEKRTDLEFEGLFPYERVLITPLGHPLLEPPATSLEQIALWPLILPGPFTFTRATLEDEFRRKGVSYEIIMELDSVDMVKRYVALGLGVSVGPLLAIDPGDERALGIVRLTTLLPVDQAGIVTLRGKTLSGPTRDFIAVAKEMLSASGPA